MMEIALLEPVDYLIIGHLTIDETSGAKRLGGTAAYAGRMAQALGLRVGIVTAWGAEIPLTALAGIPVASFPADRSTTFQNIETPAGRSQHLLHAAPALDFYLVPEPWRTAPIVHLAPVAQEVEPTIVRNFSAGLVGVTPQGWLRRWDKDGLVSVSEWPESSFVLQRAGAAVLSLEDVQGDEERIYEMAVDCHVLAVTEGSQGARLYWNGDVRRFPAPQVNEVDATGAGDIFAAAFFSRLATTRDPWEAARFAVALASISVTRPGLQAIPTPDEIATSLIEVLS